MFFEFKKLISLVFYFQISFTKAFSRKNISLDYFFSWNLIFYFIIKCIKEISNISQKKNQLPFYVFIFARSLEPTTIIRYLTPEIVFIDLLQIADIISMNTISLPLVNIFFCVKTDSSDLEAIKCAIFFCFHHVIDCISHNLIIPDHSHEFMFWHIEEVSTTKSTATTLCWARAANKRTIFRWR